MDDLEKLYNEGYKWIARDEYDNTLWVYKEKPIKFGMLFGAQPNDNSGEQIDDNKLDFITWDNSPFILFSFLGEMLFKNDKGFTKTIPCDISKMENIFLSDGIYLNKDNGVPENHNRYLPAKIVHNTKNKRTTIIYHDNTVIRTQPNKCDLNNSTLELGVIIGLLKRFNMRDINAIIGYVWKNYRTTRQKEIYLRSLLHSLYFEAEISVSQVDKIIKSLADNKSEVIVGEHKIKLEVKE